MKVNVFDSDNSLLIASGDFHLGHKNCQKHEIKKMINEVKRTGAMFIGMGDFIEGIVATDKRFNMDHIDQEFLTGDLIHNQYEYLENLFRPIRKQIV